MCGRYNLITDADAIADFFELLRSEIAEIESRYNIAPSQSVPIVRQENGKRVFEHMRWGLMPSWLKDPRKSYSMINARAETVAEKPAFRQAFANRRCLVPATGFYEWPVTNGRKQPHHIQLRDKSVFAMAGIWERCELEGEVIDTFSIVVTAANQNIGKIHDRMPVLLHKNDHERWLDENLRDPQLVLPLLDTHSDPDLIYYPVGHIVNSPRNDNKKCVEPVELQPIDDLFG